MKQSFCAMGILLLSMFAGLAMADPQLSVSLNWDDISTVDDLQIFGSVEWNEPDLLTDVYLAAMDDTGAIRFFYEGCPAPQPRAIPFRSQLFLPQGHSIDSYLLAEFGGEMLAFSSVPGSYWIMLALTHRGYLDLACEPVFAPFEIHEPEPPCTFSDAAGNLAIFNYKNRRWHLVKLYVEILYWRTEYNSQGWSSSGPGVLRLTYEDRVTLDENGFGSHEWPDAWSWDDGGGSWHGSYEYWTRDVTIDITPASAVVTGYWDQYKKHGSYYRFSAHGTLETELTP
ncbi:hypothetical protein J7M28_09895 [bacterium]|nr:hypothetical protein [bacterium]